MFLAAQAELNLAFAQLAGHFYGGREGELAAESGCGIRFRAFSWKGGPGKQLLPPRQGTEVSYNAGKSRLNKEWAYQTLALGRGVYYYMLSRRAQQNGRDVR